MNIFFPLALWLHDLNPIALPIPMLPTGGIRWYGLAYLAGFIAGWWLVRRVLSSGNCPSLPVPPKQAASDLIMTVAMGLLIGGRLGYCVFYDRDLLGFSEGFPYWDALRVWKGGMASHGGMIGAAVGAWWWARKMKYPKLFTLDLIAFAAPMGLFFGRMANFINGELYGRVCDKDFPLAVQFPSELLDHYQAPLLTTVEHALTQQTINSDIPMYGLPRSEGWINIEKTSHMLRQGNEALHQVLGEHLTPRHPVQLYAGASEGLLVMLALLICWWKPRKAGVISGVFCLTYAAARIVNEMFRQADVQFRKSEENPVITMGQGLSVFVAISGICLLVYAWRKSNDPLGGWRSSTPADTSAETT